MDTPDSPDDLSAEKALKCFACKHLIEWPYCFAFLTGAGIPEEIRYGLEDHSRSYPGDHGIRYLPFDSPYDLSEEGFRRLMLEYKSLRIMPQLPGPDSILEAGPLSGGSLPSPGRPISSLELIAASVAGDLTMVGQLLEWGADVNVQDSSGNTALMAACRNCDLEVVRLLLEHGADVNIEDNSSRTALYIATAWGYPTIAQLLKIHGAAQ